MRNKNKRRGGIIATALVLLALSASPAAYGQKTDSSATLTAACAAVTSATAKKPHGMA